MLSMRVFHFFLYLAMIKYAASYAVKWMIKKNVLSSGVVMYLIKKLKVFSTMSRKKMKYDISAR